MYGDFNSEITEFALKNLCNNYHLKNLINVPTCFKNPLKPSSIDHSFQDTQVIEPGLRFFSKQEHETVFFRNNAVLREVLNRELLKYDLNNIEYDTFREIIVSLLNVYAPVKKKYLGANHEI